MYAAERAKPPVPWKPNTSEDAELEKIRAQKRKVQQEMEEKNKTTDEEKLEGNAVSTEFNLLAELIVAPPEQDDNFKPVLFPEWLDSEPGGGGKAKAVDDNIINIDLGSQKQDLEKVKKAMEDFGETDLKKASEKNTGDDLLDMMDGLGDD